MVFSVTLAYLDTLNQKLESGPLNTAIKVQTKTKNTGLVEEEHAVQFTGVDILEDTNAGLFIGLDKILGTF